MERNTEVKGLILIVVSCLVFAVNICAFAESNPTQAQTKSIQAAAPAATLTKADLDEIQRIVDESVGKKIRPVIRDLAMLNQPKEPGFTEIIGGIGYIFGIVGVGLYFLSKKEGKK